MHITVVGNIHDLDRELSKRGLFRDPSEMIRVGQYEIGCRQKYITCKIRKDRNAAFKLFRWFEETGTLNSQIELFQKQEWKSYPAGSLECISFY